MLKQQHFFWVREGVNSIFFSNPPIGWSENGFREGNLLRGKSANGYPPFSPPLPTYAPAARRQPRRRPQRRRPRRRRPPKCVQEKHLKQWSGRPQQQQQATRESGRTVIFFKVGVVVLFGSFFVHQGHRQLNTCIGPWQSQPQPPLAATYSAARLLDNATLGRWGDGATLASSNLSPPL